MDGEINPRHVKIIVGILALVFLVILFLNSYLIDFALSYLLVYRYLTLFIIVFLAGFCVPIPVNILLMAAGALSSTGLFNFYYSFAIATVANATGDVIAYLLFRKYSHEILREKYAMKYPFFLRLEQYFQSHTSLSIVVSRLVGIFGTPVNFLSGYFKIPAWQFITFDLIGNTIFVYFFLRLGAWLGDRWIAISNFVGTIMSVLSFAILFFLIYILFFKKDKPVDTI